MNLAHSPLKTCTLFLAAGICAFVARADFNPVALTTSSFNADVVVEHTAPGPIGRATNASMDGGTNNSADSWYEIGFNTAAPTTGVPAAGTTFSSASIATHQYRMAPSYTANNAMLINGVVSNGTWTVTTPATYTNLSFLTSGGHNGRTIGVAVHHQDGTVERSSFISPDWFNGASPAVTANGRVNVQTFGFDNVNSGNPRLYNRDITLSNIGSPVVSIDLTNASVSGGDVGVFAVSGTAPGSGTWTPIAVTGYNADMIVEAGAPQPTLLSAATTASMDAGVGNAGNTWFEAGYDPFLPTNGLPAANTTITSANQPDHHYLMPPSYSANDALMLDGSFLTGSLTPAAPASFSALAFLTASAGGDVPINALVQHQDGSSESLSFTARDWFNNSPVAYNVNGRINLNNRALTDENANPLNPRLYEPQIALANTVSPVTNVALTYGGSGTPRATIFAMSGTAGAVPPIIDSSPASVITFEGPDETFTATISGGTPPLTYRWQKGTNGVFANLSDGGNIIGATTTSLTVKTVGLSDAADYRLVVSNIAGSVNSGVATLTVLSSLPDVTAPGDPITAFGGTSPVGEEVIHAIDDNTSKYLNFGQNTTPFGGPVGFIVTPAFGASRVTVMRFYTANDFPERDPADYLLEGSNDGGTSYTLISSGPLALPTPRNNGGNTLDPLTQPMQQVSFPNFGSYTTYRVTFTHVKNAAGANSCQIGEVELLGVPADLTVSASPNFLNVYPGNPAQFNGSANPVDPSTTYQWQRSTNGTYVNLQDGPNISGSTTATLNLNSVSFGDAGTYLLVVSNSTTFAASAPVLLNVLSTLNDVTAPLDTITIFNGSSPAAEVVSNAVDNTTGKYLNYGSSGTQLPPFVGPVGLVVTPAAGVTVVTALRMYTANDAPERDPAGFKLEGSNDNGTSWSLIVSNALALPVDRNPAGLALDPVAQPNQEVRFGNSQGYRSYRLTVNTVRNNATANSMQFGEIELLGRATAVLSVSANPNGSITISSSAPGELQSTTSLSGPSPVWTDAGPISGTVTIFPAPGEPQKFYRVLLP